PFSVSVFLSRIFSAFLRRFPLAVAVRIRPRSLRPALATRPPSLTISRTVIVAKAVGLLMEGIIMAALAVLWAMDTGRPAVAAFLLAVLIWLLARFLDKATLPRWQLFLAYAAGVGAGLGKQRGQVHFP